MAALPAALFAASVSIGAVYVAAPGDLLQIPITVSSGSDLAGVNIRAEFDPDILTSPDVARGPLLSSLHRLSWSAPTTGSLNIAAWAPPGAPAFAGRSGTVFTIQLRVSSSAERGEAHLIRFSALGPGNLAPSGLRAFSGSSLPHTLNNGQVVYPQYAPVAVSNVSRSGYAIGNLLPGSKVYNAGSYAFVSPIADRLLGHTYILTDQDDKDAAGSGFIQFDISQKAVVYVAIDKRITAPPAWLNTWTKRSERLATTESTGYERVLYSKQLSKGRVSLGANRDTGMPTGRNMYSVVIVPDITSSENWSLYSE